MDLDFALRTGGGTRVHEVVLLAVHLSMGATMILWSCACQSRLIRISSFTGRRGMRSSFMPCAIRPDPSSRRVRSACFV
jgi:hypothetical protein